MISQRTVLLVDDETDVTEVLAFSLRRDGFRVLVASEAAEGLAVAKSEHPDVILLDVMMPGISGWEALERLKADPDTKGIPVLMCTVLAEARFLAQAAEHGAAGYIRKPFMPDAVTRTLRGILESGSKYSPADPGTAGPETPGGGIGSETTTA
ncbi:MAG TPA: response regulator [Actinomycetota bacterium]|nr:response regulator [Actinomycetota bacterium]